jgi:glycerol-3-phosphate dehydrogenase
MPTFRWFSGLLNAPLKFLGLMDRPAERGGVIIKMGLIMYDWFTRKNRATPTHKLLLRKAALEKYPHIHPDIQAVATYYDAWMPTPERICIDLLMDAAQANRQAFALNYVPVTGSDGQHVTITDSMSGESLQIRPRVVVNAAGPWIDFVNKAIDHQTRFIGGTKGSHLVLDHLQLLEATGGSEFFFENQDGRIVLILPFLNRVMVGTTDIRIENPDEAVCTEEEVDYILGLIPRIFPNIPVDRSHIVYRFTGVRPLPAADDRITGTISRDHSIRTVGPDDQLKFAVHALIGGKWTTWRAFSEQAADLVMRELGVSRTVHTAELPIGGGKGYPTSEAQRQTWLNSLHDATGLPMERLSTLLDRYGTRAESIAQAISQSDDVPLKTLPDYSHTEIAAIAQQEMVMHLDDFLQRRSLIALLGYVTLNPGLLDEVAGVIGTALGWDAAGMNSARTADEIQRTTDLLREKHGVDLQAGESA